MPPEIQVPESLEDNEDSLDLYMKQLDESLKNEVKKPTTAENIDDYDSDTEGLYQLLKKREQESNFFNDHEDADKIAAQKEKLIAPSINVIDTRSWNKNIYQVDENIENMTLEESVDLKKRLGIETLGTRVPRPIGSFLHLSKCVPPTIIARLAKLGFVQPTPVQCQAIPCLLQGRNTIIISETGSGKTLSYLIPIVVHVLSLIKQWESVATKKSIYALILTLNRELCYQVYNVLNKLCKHINLRIACISSDADKKEQFKTLLDGCEIAVCSPVRLIDLVRLKGVRLSSCNYVVVDESDRMFTREYYKQTISILNSLRDDALKVFVSATTTDDIYKKMKSLIRNSITIKVGITQGINLNNIDLKFVMMFSKPNYVQKKTWLADHITHLESKSQNIIFCNHKETVFEVYKFLSSTADNCAMAHSDIPPDQRNRFLQSFKSGRCKTLVTTDLVCRGIDIPSVGCVINYDAPKHFHTFMHRVGRCSRNNSKGISYTFFSKSDSSLAAHIAHYMETSVNSGPKLDVPNHLLNLAMSFAPYKQSKSMGIDFIKYLSGDSFLSGDKKTRNKRQLEPKHDTEFVASKVHKSPDTDTGYNPGNIPIEDSNIGKEYNAMDDIPSSSDDDIVVACNNNAVPSSFPEYSTISQMPVSDGSNKEHKPSRFSDGPL
ncbi:DEAD box ATP-dependent RNA helicase family member protein [Theileria equi strain WA]|uniref:DEAD box ATP-dependent RNA helicase family member protein n=1 Tax=Theileria equi strain WA TaxID=1537102 RepID=L0AVU2_THEEQ|nr:DEAD box ATP-dependent RNA helicase family member protein [Theileria equi strain WA]AFZ79146.1 DEAD box ATP-dependent RNA helicase family member protein [Theileria equi strain WA]|eukprot:XP_004828812.1 DEAD box ATP-dependent RNA helicase family member protein [Theileria equi strain WA]